MKKLLPYFFVLIAIQTMAQSGLTLEEAVETALENNYNIKIARNNKSIAENNFSLGNAGFLPTVTLDFNRTYGISSFEQQLSSGTERADDGVKNNRQAYGANLNWTIFNGMQMFTTYEQLEELQKQSEESLKAEIELLLFNIKTTYYQAALERERYILYDSNVLLSEQRLKVAYDKYSLGKASKLEYLQAQVDLNTDKSFRIQQQQLLANRKYELLRLMAAEDDNIDFVLDYNLDIEETLSLDILLENIELQNPQLSALRRNQVIAERNQRINEGERLPVVNLFAGYTHTNSESPAGFAIENTSDDISYGLTASWTIFNGFNINRRIQNAKIQSQNAQLQYQNQLLDFSTNVKTRYIDYQNSLELMALEKENLTVARENNEIAKERYKIGLSNPVELREAQLNFLDAELRYQNAAFNAKLGEIELRYLAGMSN